MNPFRITLLVLLSLAVLIMLYVVGYVIPEQQATFQQYQNSVKMGELNKRGQMHQAALQRVSIEADKDELALAEADALSAARQQEEALAAAEEQRLIALARQKAEQESNAAVKAPVSLGYVDKYDAEWNSIFIIPQSPSSLTSGMKVAVMRNGGMVCEAIIESRDDETGQFTASAQENNLGVGSGKAATMPASGDDIVISPFAVQDSTFTAPSPALMPSTLPTIQQQPVQPSAPSPLYDQEIPEVEASFNSVS